ncbi:hypothetical protein BJX99DRAFT_254871 [Aspergillus californicus]
MSKLSIGARRLKTLPGYQLPTSIIKPDSYEETALALRSLLEDHNNLISPEDAHVSTRFRSQVDVILTHLLLTIKEKDLTISCWYEWNSATKAIPQIAAQLYRTLEPVVKEATDKFRAAYQAPSPDTEDSDMVTTLVTDLQREMTNCRNKSTGPNQANNTQPDIKVSRL